MKFSTQKRYPHLLCRHLLPIFGDRPLCEIRRVDIQRFVTEKMTRQNLSWQTAVHLRNLMSGTLERAVEWGYLEANPARRIKMPPMQRRRKIIVLTREQLATLLKVLQEPVKMLAITVAMTGLRIGEVLALRWKNVDFEKDIIRVREAVYEGNISSPKSKAASGTFRSGRPCMSCSRITARQHLLTRLFLPAGTARHWIRTICWDGSSSQPVSALACR